MDLVTRLTSIHHLGRSSGTQVPSIQLAHPVELVQPSPRRRPHGIRWLVWHLWIQTVVAVQQCPTQNDGTAAGWYEPAHWCLAAREHSGYARRSPSVPHRPLAQCHCSMERVPRDQNYVALTGPNDGHHGHLRDGLVLRAHLETTEIASSLLASSFTGTCNQVLVPPTCTIVIDPRTLWYGLGICLDRGPQISAKYHSLGH